MRLSCVNIIGNDNGAGLSRDAALLLRTLAASGIAARWTKPGGRTAGLLIGAATHAWLSRTRPWFDVNLFLERIDRRWLTAARRNVFIPNPEWFVDEDNAIAAMDLVLCKTWDAVSSLAGLAKDVNWIGFTAEDRFKGSLAASRELKALHVAGRSIYKGTRRTVEVWRRHPDWPPLTVVHRPHAGEFELDQRPAPNITFVTHRLDDDVLFDLQRSHALHVLPSEIEGFGQALAEGLSVGAIVITTDAPPMNELIALDRGLLAAATPMAPFRLGMRYAVDPSSLEARVEEAVCWSAVQRSTVGANARDWFLENDRRFRKELPRALGLAV